MTELQRCSNCKCMKLLSFFKVRKNTGKILKTCIQCGERYRCDQEKCDYKCSSNRDLKIHIKSVHNNIKDFECPKCDYKSSSNAHLLQHVKSVHDNIRDFECTYPNCGLKFTGNSQLRNHVKAVHDKIRDFECTYPDCKFTCSTNGNLQIHYKMVHDRIKDFECPHCDFTCSTNGNLQLHIKMIHDKIKNFECQKCEFKCSANSDLQRHINICTGLRNISSGEFKTIQCLEELGFYEDEDYRHNSSFPELTKYCGKALRFDFMFINHKRVFEYDGEQHIRPVKFGNMSQEEAEEQFQKTKDSDKVKDDFCRENGYKMVRISYKDYPNILSILHGELMDIMDNVG